MASIEEFVALDIRVGTILDVVFFSEARKPAYKVRIDFGDEIGVKQSSAQITDRYDEKQLVGKQVVAVTNFPPMRIAGYKSEVLILGGVLADEQVVLLNLDETVPNGTKIS